MGVMVTGMEGKGNFPERNIASSKIGEAGLGALSTTFVQDLLKVLASLLCSVDLGVYYSCYARNIEDTSGSPKLAGS